MSTAAAIAATIPIVVLMLTVPVNSKTTNMAPIKTLSARSHVPTFSFIFSLRDDRLIEITLRASILSVRDLVTGLCWLGQALDPLIDWESGHQDFCRFGCITVQNCDVHSR
jgi:hypothetical protein